ncbi:MAG: hypothetical protein ACLQME_07680 [Alphaproteobacteria bacterium]
MSSFLPFCTRCFRRLKACAAEDFLQAAVEVGVICFSAFLPLIAGLVIFPLTNVPHATARYEYSFLTSGDMLLICCAIIGPLIYVVTRKYGKFIDPLTIRFPYSTGFSLIIVVIWFIAGGVFVAKKSFDLYVAGPNFFDDNAMWWLSVIITVIAIGHLYMATVFRNCLDRIDPGDLMHDDQEEFVKDFGNG